MIDTRLTQLENETENLRSPSKRLTKAFLLFYVNFAVGITGTIVVPYNAQL